MCMCGKKSPTWIDASQREYASVTKLKEKKQAQVYNRADTKSQQMHHDITKHDSISIRSATDMT